MGSWAAVAAQSTVEFGITSNVPVARCGEGSDVGVRRERERKVNQFGN